jgi:hypothetical protein
MKTVNSLSGGKTSSYIAANYPADYNVFALVRTDDKNCIYPDAKVRQIVSDKIGKEFIGTTEQDNIIKIMLDLEQFIGSEIIWLTGVTFDDVVLKKGGWLPNVLHRYCTTNLKLFPIMEWWKKNINEVVEMRIGFRANEKNRAKKILDRCNKKGIQLDKFIIGKRKTQNKWGLIEWRQPTFPLINDNIFKDKIENFWSKNKAVRFEKGYYNNCVGCFHRNPIFLKKMSVEHPNKIEWFAKQEGGKNGYWRSDIKYADIQKWNIQTELSFDDFNECDSGYCGL